MATKKKAVSKKKSEQERIQCHFISNTHWDREWRYSAQRTRHMLVYMLDMLFDIFEKEPEFKSFHLDSQTMPIQDYLEARPEMRETVRKYVESEKLFIGPWYCLPDEFCVGPESIIRNLLLGHKMAKGFGKVSKTGYSPFSWGQLSQIPQIYSGFGIDIAMFYRGINTLESPRSEFIWEGADGTRIIGSRLGLRPRYNIWYLIQRPVYWDQKNPENRVMSWKTGHGPFRFIDSEKCELDYQYVHPEFQYNKDYIPKWAKYSIEEQNNDWTTPHRFWSAGHDSSCPDIREVQMIKDCDEALGDTADVFHSTVTALQDGIRENKKDDWPVLKGEMRHPYTKGSGSKLIGWVTSARMYLKQENFRCERALMNYAEPMAVCAGLLGAPYPGSFIDIAHNWLLQNHGHDSIAGCSRDIVHEDMMFRYRQVREIGKCVIERAMMDLAGAVNFSKWSSEEMAIFVYNPASFERTEIIETNIDIPQEWNCGGFVIVDEKDKELPMEILDKQEPFYQVVQSPNDVANNFPSTRYQALVEFPKIPSLGYRIFKAKPVKEPHPFPQPVSQLAGPQSVENEFFRLTINPNGTFDIFHKETSQLYENLCYLKDESEKGNPWEHITVANDTVFTTLSESASVRLLRDGELETTFEIVIDWKLPECRSEDEKSRSDKLKPFPVKHTLTVRKNVPWVEMTTEVDNTVEDHYLQVCFPTGIQADKVMVQGHFDVIERPVPKPDYSKYDEEPMTEHPMNSFVDLSETEAGFAVLNEGLKAYSADDDPERTLSLTLLRCYPLRICVMDELTDYSFEKGSQCPGKQTYRYAVLPHAGDWEKGKVWQTSERFNLALHAAQLGPTEHGTEPLKKSFFEVKPNTLHVSAVKRSESGEGWVLRIFNPFNRKVRASVRFNGGKSGAEVVASPVERVRKEFELPGTSKKKWAEIRLVNLEEIPERDLKQDKDGWVKIDIAKKKIQTIEFLS